MDRIMIGVVAGSARREAFSVKIAKAMAGMMPPEFEMRFLEIGNLPLFNQDYDDDGTTPAEWKAHRQAVKECDGYLFVTPEYNRSYTPAIKNALDIASRPFGQNVWGGKPGAVISTSPGKPGAFGANHHLRQVLAFLNVYTMQQPEVYLGGVDKILDAQGNITDDGTRKFLQAAADAFAAWVRRFV